MELEYGIEKVSVFRCPFCGSDPKIRAYRNRGRKWFRIRCSNESETCRMVPETAAHNKLVEAAADWNQRDWNQVPGDNLDWDKAKEHLDFFETEYKKLNPIVGCFGLGRIASLQARYEIGERTKFLYDEIMSVE